MEKFELKESATTPRILINFKKGKIKLIGTSTLHNPEEFYPKVLNIAQKYFDKPLEETKVTIDLDYYHQNSFNYIFQFIELIVGLEKFKRTKLKMMWHHHPLDQGIAEDIALISKTLDYQIPTMSYELVS
ncbi:MAG: hypothetical protein COW67_10530 [Flavobacteriales bacterium CG18_big_fil_WC_8_21_14_2_50_32_9]|nr:MAG: hypothetical protein COW67_10530 [Flavobacteriales bacterium CG18_big_fil_WC_8_21_14_2_50_32_9]